MNWAAGGGIVRKLSRGKFDKGGVTFQRSLKGWGLTKAPEDLSGCGFRERGFIDRF